MTVGVPLELKISELQPWTHRIEEPDIVPPPGIDGDCEVYPLDRDEEPVKCRDEKLAFTSNWTHSQVLEFMGDADVPYEIRAAVLETRFTWVDCGVNLFELVENTFKRQKVGWMMSCEDYDNVDEKDTLLMKWFSHKDDGYTEYSSPYSSCWKPFGIFETVPTKTAT